MTEPAAIVYAGEALADLERDAGTGSAGRRPLAGVAITR